MPADRALRSAIAGFSGSVVSVGHWKGLFTLSYFTARERQELFDKVKEVLVGRIAFQYLNWQEVPGADNLTDDDLKTHLESVLAENRRVANRQPDVALRAPTLPVMRSLVLGSGSPHGIIAYCRKHGYAQPGASSL